MKVRLEMNINSVFVNFFFLQKFVMNLIFHDASLLINDCNFFASPQLNESVADSIRKDLLLPVPAVRVAAAAALASLLEERKQLVKKNISCLIALYKEKNKVLSIFSYFFLGSYYYYIFFFFFFFLGIIFILLLFFFFLQNKMVLYDNFLTLYNEKNVLSVHYKEKNKMPLMCFLSVLAAKLGLNLFASNLLILYHALGSWEVCFKTNFFYMQMTPAKRDQYDRIVEDAIDHWEGRSGVALALAQLAPHVEEGQVVQLVNFFVPEALGDRNAEVASNMLEAATALINFHGKVKCLLRLLLRITKFMTLASDN